MGLQVHLKPNEELFITSGEKVLARIKAVRKSFVELDFPPEMGIVYSSELTRKQYDSYLKEKHPYALVRSRTQPKKDEKRSS